MKKSTLVLTISASVVALTAAILTPILVINSKKNNSQPVNKEKSIVLTFSNIFYQGAIGDGRSSYLELYKENASPSKEDFCTKHELVDDYWVYHSYVSCSGEMFSIAPYIVSLSSLEEDTTPDTAFHFEFELKELELYTGAYLTGNFYTDKELTNKITRINYSKEQLSSLTILESINEYYKIELRTIVFTYQASK